MGQQLAASQQTSWRQWPRSEQRQFRWTPASFDPWSDLRSRPSSGTSANPKHCQDGSRRLW
jgi:hypothetical protein